MHEDKTGIFVIFYIIHRNTALNKIGEKSSRSQRRIHFDIIDQDGTELLDFEEFCTVSKY